MFKKSALQLLCWGSMGLAAQSTKPFPGFKAGADQVLKGISQYPVSSGILYSRVTPFSGVYGQKSESPVIWNASRFGQALHELEEASLKAPANPLAKKLQRQFQKSALMGDLQILAFCTSVHVLDTGRIGDSSLVLRNGVFSFTPKYPGQSPFREQLLSAASVMNFHPLVAGKDYRFLFPENAGPGEVRRSIVSARMKFEGEAWSNLLPGQPLVKSFSGTSSQILEIEIEWSGGLVQQFRNQIRISSQDLCQHPELFKRPDDCPDWLTNPEFAPSWPSSAISATIPFAGLSGKGEILHYNRSGSSSTSGNIQYRNPIIFVDGIDFGDSRKGETIYGKYLSYISDPGAPASVRLGAQLRQQGFDLIILNFPDGRIPENASAGKANPGIDGGCDYIERNAMVLVRLIQLVNQALEPGSRKLTVVGPSMGGIISRYALAYMEKNQAQTGNHNCGLFISQDAPHLGANIPVGTQQMIQNLAGFNMTGAEISWENLCSPAAMELMINHAKNTENTNHNELRTAFLENCLSNGLPGSLGWPKDAGLRLVAISNGNLYGNPVSGTGAPNNSIQGSGNLLNLKLEMKTKEFLTITLAIFGGGFILPPPAFLYSGSMEWNSFYAPAQSQTAKTFSFNFGFSLFDQGVDVYSEERNWKALDQYMSVDAAPGGFSNSSEILRNAIVDGFESSAGVVSLNLSHADKFHSFIPVKSALGFRWNSTGLRNVGEYLLERNLVCTGEIPFHAYFCGTGNEEHVQLSAASVEFLYKQLNYSPPGGGIQYQAEISGPKAVAAGSKSEFTALYQGNLEFRTSWSVTGANGISAIISNPFSQTCNVLVSSGTGQDNGYFYIAASTEVKNLNGEWVCAGRKSQKVQVRKIAFMGSLQTMCNTDLAPGCSFYIYGGTPDYSALNNGVSHAGYEWQLSRYNNTGFGPNCWNGALSISPAGLTPNGAQKAGITLVSSFMSGNQFTYYARARNLMRIPNPDYGLAGEPANLIIEGAWKMVQLVTIQLNGPGCVTCSGAANLEPENPVSGIDENAVLTTDQANLPATFTLTDENEVLIRDGNLLSTETKIPLKGLIPGRYSVRVHSPKGTQILEFWLRASSEDMLLAAPRRLTRNSGKSIRFRISDDHFTEAGAGEYQAILRNENTGWEQSWTGHAQEFYKSAADLPEGKYRLEITNGEKSMETGFLVLASEEKYPTIQPNPAENQIWVDIPGQDPIQLPLAIRIKDKFGQVRKVQELFKLPGLVDLSNLPPDLYLLEVLDNGLPINSWFVKN